MIHAVIMAGGSGTRFWPLSREVFPKQFLKVCGNETLLQQTFTRIEPLTTPYRIYIATNPKMGEKCVPQLPSFRKENLILEPLAKNTAPAIGLAAFRLVKTDPDAVMVLLAADHYIGDQDAFLNILKTANEAALKGFLVTLGISPTRPETGYGYIKKAGEKIPLESGNEVYPVKSFQEKPDVATAEGYIREGGYYWNSGIFVWKASVILEEIKTYMPELFETLSAMDQLGGGEQEEKERKRLFGSISPESIDFGVMEKSERAAVIPSAIPWYDVGSLAALDEVNDTDENGNFIVGNVLGLGNENTIIYAGSRMVAAIGLKDMVVVDTLDVTLVCPKDRAQDVKKITEKLKKEKAPEFINHPVEVQCWGTIATLERGANYKIRKLEVRPGESTDLLLHVQEDAQWIILSGTAKVSKGEEVLRITNGESVYIPKNTKHQLENGGKEELVVLEVQSLYV